MAIMKCPHCGRESAGKQWAIVIAGNTDKTTQFTTWGKTPEDKVYASDLSEHIGAELCEGPPVVLESFKLDAARNDALLAACKEVQAWLAHSTFTEGQVRQMAKKLDAAIAQAEKPAKPGLCPR